ncbi:hypothetical protein D3C85_1402260 [compost metagenome]
MERTDVIVLEVDLDEGLPVVVALMHFDVVQHVVAEVELGPREQRRHVGGRIARAFEQQAVAIAQAELLQVHAGRGLELRRAQQLAVVVVRPAVQRAHDVAASGLQIAVRIAVAGHVAGFAAKHQCLPVAADI